MSITFYTHPKPWLPQYTNIQTAAIQSLIAQSPQPRNVVILGDEAGTSEVAIKLGVTHRPDIKVNEWGTPLVSDIMRVIREDCTTEFACLINTDIVIGDDFIRTVRAVALEAEKYSNGELPDKTGYRSRDDGWLMIGQRTNVTPEGLNGYQDASIIREHARQNGKLHGVNGIDYFVFPRQTFQFVYPFALGKFCWDQWLVGNVYRRGCMCVDATKTVLAVHLNADWYFQGKPEKDWNKIHTSSEAVRNRDFDYYQKTIATGTTHYTKHIGHGGVVVVAHTIIGGCGY